MNTFSLREQLHQRIDTLPDELVEQLSDFTLFMLAKKRLSTDYSDWTTAHWQAFALAQFFRDEEPVEYQLTDAEEIYQSA